uniref:Uncharacterized protein n=1 Tax=Rhizophora mucronata TaxID=61149 RepID=A0A2P2QP35_RHIMU
MLNFDTTVLQNAKWAYCFCCHYAKYHWTMKKELNLSFCWRISL